MVSAGTAGPSPDATDMLAEGSVVDGSVAIVAKPYRGNTWIGRGARGSRFSCLWARPRDRKRPTGPAAARSSVRDWTSGSAAFGNRDLFCSLMRHDVGKARAQERAGGSTNGNSRTQILAEAFRNPVPTSKDSADGRRVCLPRCHRAFRWRPK